MAHHSYQAAIQIGSAMTHSIPQLILGAVLIGIGIGYILGKIF